MMSRSNGSSAWPQASFDPERVIGVEDVPPRRLVHVIPPSYSQHLARRMVAPAGAQRGPEGSSSLIWAAWSTAPPVGMILSRPRQGSTDIQPPTWLVSRDRRMPGDGEGAPVYGIRIRLARCHDPGGTLDACGSFPDCVGLYLFH